MRIPVLFLLCLMGMTDVQAQVVLENNPASIKWFKVETPHFRVIFPEGFQEKGMHMANTLEHIYEPDSKSLGVHPRKFSIIYQNQSVENNGFVTMSPPHSEIYAMPPQNASSIGPVDWLDFATTHEYRHIVQYQRANTGFLKGIRYLFGPATFGAFAAGSVPLWFWEGDAVTVETAFSDAGRGRIPQFNLVFRTNLLSGKDISYSKQYLRSYKDFIPDHYRLGYFMVSYLRKRTGDPSIWDKIGKRAWSAPFIPFAFSNAIHKETGLHVNPLYKDMMADLKEMWQKQIDTLSLTTFETITHRQNRAFTNYVHPNQLTDGRILALKSGIGDYSQFVAISRDGTEKTVFVPGILNDAGMLSVAGETVVWNEFGYDPRWKVRNYSVIKAYNIKTGKLTVLSKKSRYGGAAISPDGSRVLTVKTDTAYHHHLVVIDFLTHKVLSTLPNPDNDFYSMPRWIDNHSFVVLKTMHSERTISRFNLDDGTSTDLLPPSDEITGHPVVYGHYLIFNSPITGIDNVHALDLSNGKRYRITNSKYGATDATVSTDGSTLFYSDQTPEGMDLVQIPFDPASWKVYVPAQSPQPLVSTISSQEGEGNLLENIPDQTYPLSHYSISRRIINPYSWGVYFDNTLSQADIGLVSRDILNTTTLKLGYLYNVNEQTGLWSATLSYQGAYPIFDLAYRFGDRTSNEGNYNILTINNGDSVILNKNLTFNWHEQILEGGVRLPLVFTHSKYYEGVTIGSTIGLTRITDFRNSFNNAGIYPNITGQRYVPAIIQEDTITAIYRFRNQQATGDLFYNRSYLTAYRYLKQSQRDIYPRWGQYLSVEYNKTLAIGDYHGGLFAASGILFFPGLFKHHSFYVRGAYQNRNVAGRWDDYVFSTRIPLPRGHTTYRFVNVFSTLFNYALPVWYPDVAVGPLINFKRVRANLFYDYAFGDQVLFSTLHNQIYTSTGAEMNFDLNVMRFLPQFDMGFRVFLWI